MDIGHIINQRRLFLGLTLEDVGNAVGVSKSTVKKWEDGYISNMKRDKISELAKVLKISPVVLITGELEENSKNNSAENLTVLPSDKIFMRPLYNSVAAGIGAVADNTILTYIPTFISNSMEKDMYIWVNVQGDSMSPLIDDGSKILIKKQESVDSGQIAVVLIDDEEAVVKKIQYGKDWIELISVNPYYPPRRFEGSEVLRVRVVGLVKQIMKELQ